MRRILNTVPRGILLLMALAVFPPSTAQAAGRRQIISATADGVDIWQHDFNVSGMKPGTYNVLVNATDSAGNVGVSGPFNVKVDPMAGLPESRIVYPEEGQIVRSDVHIVGVATARYGLKQVYVKIDNGEYIPLEGNTYWDYRIPADELREGKHTVYTKAVDVNDLTGPELKVDFILDVNPPVIELTNHEIGDIIARTVKIKGRVSDLNGIRSLQLSTDGENFKPLPHQAKRGDPGRHFQFTIKTKKLDDGPLVYYVRAVNRTGTSVTTPFLFFINNNPPEIEILSPEPAENVYGRTQVTGRVISVIGLSAFYYEWAGERNEIELRPGDPFWTADITFSMANNRPVPFRITAVDKSGNVATVTQRLQDTREFRTPTIIIDYPPAPRFGRINIDYDEPIYGHISPGFFPFAIQIEGEIEWVMAQPSFRIDPHLLPPGRNTLRLAAMEEDLITGQYVNLSYTKAAPPDGFVLQDSPLIINSPEEYDWVTNSVTVEGSVGAYAGQNVQYRLRWDDNWKPVNVNSRGEFRVTVDLTGLPDGPVPMEIRTVAGSRGDIPYYLPVNKYSAQPEITFVTPQPRFGTVHGGITTTGTIISQVPLEDVSYSVDGEEYLPMDYTAKAGRAWFNGFFDYSVMHYEGNFLSVRVEDRAGNVVEASPEIEFDNSNDFPIAIVNSPLDGELITGDSYISGLAYDDDGVAAVYWRILTPRNPWDPPDVTLSRRAVSDYQRVDTTQNFLIPYTLDDLADGENIMELFVEDIYGITGEVTRRIFKVSTAPPETVVDEPAMDVWSRGNIIVRGSAFDLNGIESIIVSMDNGLSYQRADFVSSQTEASEWGIALNTKAYADGVYSMLIRTIDRYGVTAFSNAIINIDNTPPEIDLGSPRDGDSIGTMLPVTGRVYDNIALRDIAVQLVNIDNPQVQLSFDLPPEFVIMESVDVSEFPDGEYTLKVSAFDQPGNETIIIRNFTLQKARAASEVAIINPMPGIEHFGPLILSGTITGAVIPETVSLMLNSRPFANVEVNRYGVFRYEVPEAGINRDAPVVFSASFLSPDGGRIVSYDNTVKLSQYGPVIIVDSHLDGDVITSRPYISGRAFMVVPEEEDRTLTRAQRRANSVSVVELSFDNGRTFVPAKGTGSWRYRLETSELSAGTLPIVIKATFANDKVAIRRIVLTVDTRAPEIKTIGPTENSAHRDTISVYGSVYDDYDIDSVEVQLRPGDKAGYAVPGFIQGLYFDASILGGYIWTTGLGLTFFDDNVKLQFVYGQAAPGRYEGQAIGGKVLANIYRTKLSRWFGLDWDFWTTSLTVGAHFSYFLMGPTDPSPVWMGQFLGQWEIIKADMSYFFPKWKYFKSFSLYTEYGIWFAPSDVDLDIDPNAWRTRALISFGLRMSLF